jgi:eukaryotic-like serine/threonine-protein kinase
VTLDRSRFTAPFAPFVDDGGLEFGRYVVKSMVGEGSMAQVYRAYDPLAERDVALKVLRADAGWRQGKDGRVRFFREAEAAGRLSHPHIVTIYDVTEDYIVMEYLDGVTLEYLLSWRAPLPLDDAMAILHPLAAALDFAHERGIVHRDVKPGNILILTDGRPKLTDFGVAHLESTTITAPGEFLGSPSYMSPEQVDGKAVSARSDVFSLAAVAYEMFTGTRAFGGMSVPAALNAVLNVMPAPPCTSRPELPPHIDAVFAQALAKKPDERHASAGAFAAALDAAGFERTCVRLSRGESVGGPAASVASDAAALPDAAAALDVAAISARSIAAAETRDLGLVARSWRKVSPADMARSLAASLRHWAAVIAAGTAIAALVSVLLDPLGVFGKVQPVPPTPRLDVETQPPGAAVWLDGQPLGGSPVVGMKLAAGRHEIAVDRAGFASVRFAFEARPSAAFSITLHPQSAVRARPAGSTTAVVRPGEVVEASSATSGERGAALAPRPAGEDDTTAARRMSGESARYPAEAIVQRLQGTVALQFVITPDGLTSQAAVTESAGDILDKAVLDAVANWRFWPATQGGRPVAVRWQVRQRFEIKR